MGEQLSGNMAAGQADWREVEEALSELAVLERRALVDDSQSTLLSAVTERTKQRIRTRSADQEVADAEREKVRQRIGLVAAGLREALRLRVEEPGNNDQVSPDELRTPPSYDRDARFLPKSETVAANAVVFLVHGIHTHGQWFRTVRRVLDAVPCQVVEIKFGYWNVTQFLIPGRREFPISKVAAVIRQAKIQYPGARLFAIAHSFGTYALMHALRDPTFEMTRVILCGSIVPENFVPERYFLASGGGSRILNDCGVRDIWPVLAKCSTWGYGATGTFGMGTSFATNRYFNIGHGEFFTREFVTKYWVPFITNGLIVPSPIADDDAPWPWYFSVLNQTVWRWAIWGIVFILIAIAVVLWAGKVVRFAATVLN
jgi:hypothetical protein